MYTSFYGFREKPFSLSPDPRYLFLAASHREALAHLLYGIEHGEGFIAITGEVGTGKTTLSRTLLQRMPSGSEVAVLLNPDLSAHDLLCAIHEELGLRGDAALSKRELRDQLNRFLLEQNQAQRRVLLIIDEAQSLPEETLEQVRLLSNLETDTAKLLQIILLGQPELDIKLQKPELRQLRQRITVWWRLAPLTEAETREYVEHRLRVASGEERKIFSEAALALLHRRTGGIPRLINVFCDRALLAAYADNVLEVDAGILRRVAQELEGHIGDVRSRRLSASLSRKRIFGESREAIARSLPSWKLILAIVILSLSFGYFAKRARGLDPKWFSRMFQNATEQSFNLHSTPSSVESVAGSRMPHLATSSSESGREETAPSQSLLLGSLGSSEKFGEVLPLPDFLPASDMDFAKHFASVPWLSPEETKVPEQPVTESAASTLPLAQELAAALPGASSASAANAMLRLWGLAPSASEPLSMAGALLELERQGLRTLWFHETSLDELQKINSPALLTLVQENSELRMVVLEHFEGDRIFLTGLDGATHFRVERAELEKHWSHSAAVVWRDFEALPDRIQPGSHADAVRWLQAHLQTLGFSASTPTGVYDAQTKMAVQKFQKQFGLDVDGIVGVRTKWMLYRASPEYTTPQLHSAEDAG